MTNEKAINNLKQLKEYHRTYYGSMYFKVEVKADEEMKETIDTVLSLIKENQKQLDKKDKQIDLMARAIDNYDSQLEINTFKDKEHIKQYFGELAEKE